MLTRLFTGFRRLSGIQAHFRLYDFMGLLSTGQVILASAVILRLGGLNIIEQIPLDGPLVKGIKKQVFIRLKELGNEIAFEVIENGLVVALQNLLDYPVQKLGLPRSRSAANKKMRGFNISGNFQGRCYRQGIIIGCAFELPCKLGLVDY